MSVLSDSLRSSWDQLLPSEPDLGEQLIAAYADTSRHYHDLRHLSQVLTWVEKLAKEAADIEAVRLAAWYHDAVYDVRATDNEERSAQLAESTLPGTAVPPERITEVARLIRLTDSHAAEPDDANGRVLCDADLAILGSGPDAYASYARSVRVEYAHVPEEDFRRGRAAVLQSLLDLPQLFNTKSGRAEWESAARANVTAELKKLLR